MLGLDPGRRIKTRGKEKEQPAWQSWTSLMFQLPRWLEQWEMILEENQNFWKKVLKRKKGVKIIVIFNWKQTACKSLLCCCELFLKLKQRLSVVQQLSTCFICSWYLKSMLNMNILVFNWTNYWCRNFLDSFKLFNIHW